MDFNTLWTNPLFQKILLWSALGLGVGLAAKILLPGHENMGWIRTILLGLAGSILGNTFAPKLLGWPEFSLFSWQGLCIGVGSAFVLVLINRVVTRS